MTALFKKVDCHSLPVKDLDAAIAFEIRIGLCAVLQDPWHNPLVILDQSKGLLRTDADGNVVGLDSRTTRE